MTWQDFINGFIFELLGAVVVWLNVRTLMRDRVVAGVSWWAFAFFVAWGCWNMYYYPHLGQWASFIGAVLVVLANLTWCILALRYGRSSPR